MLRFYRNTHSIDKTPYLDIDSPDKKDCGLVIHLTSSIQGMTLEEIWLEYKKYLRDHIEDGIERPHFGSFIKDLARSIEVGLIKVSDASEKVYDPL